MKVCAVLLNYFGHEDTIDCVKALAGKDIDRIFVLDNSQDKTEESRLRESFLNESKIAVLISDRNLGFAGGVNFVLKKAFPEGFDAYLILNNDTVLPPDLLKKLIPGAKFLSLDLAAPVIYNYPEQSRIWSKGSYYNAWTGLINHWPHILPGNFYCLTGCCLLIQRKVFETTGFFDETFFMYGEDVEFCHRAVRQGFRMGVVPDAVIYHKTGASSVQNSFFYEYHLNRAHFLLCKKLFQAPASQILSLCFKIKVLGIRAFIRTIRFGNTTAIKGYLAALFGQKARQPGSDGQNRPVL